MTGFSQPERHGVERTQTSQTHPDADLLNGFSEQTLTDREREQVLAHMARCETCREIVALAVQPAVTPDAEPLRQPTFWKWPVVRWGAVAASAVIVVIAVSLGVMEKTSAPKMSQVTTETAPLAVPPTPTQPTTTKDEFAASPGMKAPQVRYEKVAPETKQQLSARADTDTAVAKKKELLVAGPGAASGGILGGTTAMTTQDKAVQAHRDEALATNTAVHGNAAMAKMAAVPPPSQAATPASSATASAAPETVAVTTQAAPVDRMQGATTAEMVPKGRQSSDLQTARVAAPRVANRSYRLNALDQRWQVTPEGYLLSSTDQGKNWARQLPDLRFTHVQTIGAHVWACGPDGVLMHSTDGGMNWTRVTPTDQSVTLQGEITSIVFADVNHGTLKTSKGESWTTADAGQRWKKQ